MTTTSFKDHFSRIASSYAAFRPQYPDQLFSWLAAQLPTRDLAWDAGTGNGQAAIGLSTHFKKVIATDASAEQIASARPNAVVTYEVAPCDASPLAPRSADLVTAAAAAHWFPHEAFHAEVRRVIKPGGMVAVWTYWNAHVSPSIDAILERLQFTLVGPYWPPERRYVNDGYRSLPFPFDEIRTPDFEVTAEWDLDHFIGYLGTWSAVQRYKELVGRDPVTLVHRELSEAWGTQRRTVKWPLALRAGRI